MRDLIKALVVSTAGILTGLLLAYFLLRTPVFADAKKQPDRFILYTEQTHSNYKFITFEDNDTKQEIACHIAGFAESCWLTGRTWK